MAIGVSSFPILSFDQANPIFEGISRGLNTAYAPRMLNEELLKNKLSNQLSQIKAQYEPEMLKSELNQRRASTNLTNLQAQYLPENMRSQMNARDLANKIRNTELMVKLRESGLGGGIPTKPGTRYQDPTTGEWKVTATTDQLSALENSLRANEQLQGMLPGLAEKITPYLGFGKINRYLDRAFNLTGLGTEETKERQNKFGIGQNQIKEAAELAMNALGLPKNEMSLEMTLSIFEPNAFDNKESYPARVNAELTALKERYGTGQNQIATGYSLGNPLRTNQPLQMQQQPSGERTQLPLSPKQISAVKKVTGQTEQELSDEDIKHTAKARGISEEEVRRRLGMHRQKRGQ